MLCTCGQGQHPPALGPAAGPVAHAARGGGEAGYVQNGAYLSDTAAFGADEPCPGVAQGEFGGGEGFGAEFVLETLDKEAVGGA